MIKESDNELAKSGNRHSLIKLIKKTIPLVLALIIGACFGYLLRPLKTTVSIYPYKSSIENKFTCKTMVGTMISPKNVLGGKKTQEFEANIFTSGADLSVEITEKKLKFLTLASLENGQLDALEMDIITRLDGAITAVKIEEAAFANKIIHTFVINTKSGVALWSKTNESFLTPVPYSSAYYYKCS